MKRGLIITLPSYDDTTEYLSKWSYEIEEEADRRGVKIKQLDKKRANKKEFEKVIKNLNYRMIVFNGHGSKKIIFGHDDKVLIKEGENGDILKNRITYSRSCDSAASIGVSCIKDSKEGCLIGYKEPYTFYINQKWATNPRKDNVAGLFLSSSNLIPVSIIKGNTCYEAHEKSRRQMLKNIKKLLRKKTKDCFLIAGSLWSNYLGQTLIGNKEATL